MKPQRRTLFPNGAYADHCLCIYDRVDSCGWILVPTACHSEYRDIPTWEPNFRPFLSSSSNHFLNGLSYCTCSHILKCLIHADRLSGTLLLLVCQSSHLLECSIHADHCVGAFCLSACASTRLLTSLIQADNCFGTCASQFVGLPTS